MAVLDSKGLEEEKAMTMTTITRKRNFSFSHFGLLQRRIMGGIFLAPACAFPECALGCLCMCTINAGIWYRGKWNIWGFFLESEYLGMYFCDDLCLCFVICEIEMATRSTLRPFMMITSKPALVNAKACTRSRLSNHLRPQSPATGT